MNSAVLHETTYISAFVRVKENRMANPEEMGSRTSHYRQKLVIKGPLEKLENFITI